MRDINKIIIHCAATKPSMDIGADEIKQWHVQRGWRTIGYHFVIRFDGTVETGRDVSEIGAHASGHNGDSIGICLVGGCDEEMNPIADYTEEQWASLKKLVGDLRDKHGPKIAVIGHNDVSSKTCPNFDVWKWRRENVADRGDE